MVQIIRGGPSRSALQTQLLGPALGEGLASFTGNYLANKALEGVIDNPEYKNKSSAERQEALQSKLSPYGKFGENVLAKRLQIENAHEQERSRGNLAKAFTFIQNNQEVPEEILKTLSGEDQFKIGNFSISNRVANRLEVKKTQASQPIDPEQLKNIQNVRNQPGFNDLSEVEQYQAFTNAGVSKENAIAEATLKGKQLKREQEAFESAYKAQEDFIKDTTNTYKAFETEMKPRLLQMRNIRDENLISPTTAVFLESLGIPLGALDDPSSELYNKLSQDLLKGLPETYGSRILKVEVDNFLKTIPTLSNSAEGRRMIASNMLKLGEMKEVYYNEMRKQQRESLDKNKPLPRDFQQTVFDQVKPQLDRINNEFIKLSEIKHVPPGTIPFFGPTGEVSFVPKEHAQWAQENGGRRIW